MYPHMESAVERERGGREGERGVIEREREREGGGGGEEGREGER